jgi:hypothetical protein
MGFAGSPGCRNGAFGDVDCRPGASLRFYDHRSGVRAVPLPFGLQLADKPLLRSFLG